MEEDSAPLPVACTSAASDGAAAAAAAAAPVAPVAQSAALAGAADAGHPAAAPADLSGVQDQGVQSVDAPHSSSAPSSSAAAGGGGAPRAFDSAESRRAFYAASTAARKARKVARHEARQAEQVAAKVARQKRDQLEAVEWCRENLHINPAAVALHQAAAVKDQRCNILLQFIGTQYKGMQLQNRSQVPTVEGCLLRALYTAGGVDSSPSVTLSDLQWTRTARTDAGVHAVNNVVSCRLLLDDGLTERVNAELPRDIRVLAILPVADLSGLLGAMAEAQAQEQASSNVLPPVILEAVAFALHTYGYHPRESCTGRLYDYVMPVAVLQAPAERQQQDQPSASAASSAAVVTPFSPLFTGPPPSCAPSFDLDSFHQARMTEAECDRINAILKQFEGVKRSFHNFANPTDEEFDFLLKRAQALNGHAATSTSEAPAAATAAGTPANGTDVSAANATSASPSSPEPDFLRTVSRCFVSELFVQPSSGIQFARVRIEGKSFAFNQIRRMIGLATLVARGAVEKSIFDHAFDPRFLFDVPVAPARGLMLRRPLFAHYDAACEWTKQSDLSLGRAFDRLQAEQSPFVREQVEAAEVCNPVKSHAAFRTWLFTVHQQNIKQKERTRMDQVQPHSVTTAAAAAAGAVMEQ